MHLAVDFQRKKERKKERSTYWLKDEIRKKKEKGIIIKEFIDWRKRYKYKERKKERKKYLSTEKWDRKKERRKKRK